MRTAPPPGTPRPAPGYPQARLALIVREVAKEGFPFTALAIFPPGGDGGCRVRLLVAAGGFWPGWRVLGGRIDVFSRPPFFFRVPLVGAGACSRQQLLGLLIACISEKPSDRVRPGSSGSVLLQALEAAVP